MVGSWRHRTQRSTLYSCGPCVKTKRTCKHGRKNWAGFAWALTEPPSACGFQLVCSLIQRRLPLHFFWGLRYWKCARLGGQNLRHHRLSGSNFNFLFFFSKDPAGSLHYGTSLKDYARVSLEEIQRSWDTELPIFQLNEMCLIWTIKPYIKVNYGCFLSCRLLLFFAWCCGEETRCAIYSVITLTTRCLFVCLSKVLGGCTLHDKCVECWDGDETHDKSKTTS